ncbi:MAG: UDP-3-O-[3-hydroxymyristoyl] N-acetylglucosamine deacetylase [Bdellovibrionales bacterium]|nr:UDP-3-O-[3-hydroxymyristoyl] N-acetylglucosamine deacetylase [Bdellovibrionales bacterium]
MLAQRTVKDIVVWKGIGLHSGRQVTMRILPLPPHSGIRFVRTDLPGSPEVPALADYVVNTRLATTLGKAQAVISTVEHLMCAFFGLGIDNARVELDAAEVPISDGSSMEFYRALQEIGVEYQAASRKVWQLQKRVELKMGEKWGIAEPSSLLDISASVEFDHSAIGYQSFRYLHGQTRFEEFGSARTFGFLKEVEALKKMGLARGGSLDNAVVLDDSGVLNPGGLRYENEFARHKVLDALGDFALAGHPIQARIQLHRSGHDLHRALLGEILAASVLVELEPRSVAQRTPLRRVRAAAI